MSTAFEKVRKVIGSHENLHGDAAFVDAILHYGDVFHDSGESDVYTANPVREVLRRLSFVNPNAYAKLEAMLNSTRVAYDAGAIK